MINDDDPCDFEIVIAVNEDYCTAGITVVANEPMDKDIFLDIMSCYIKDLIEGDEYFSFQKSRTSTN